MPDPRILHISTASSWRGGEQQLAYLVETLMQEGVHQHVCCAQGSEMEQHCRSNNWSYTAVKKRSSVDPLFARTVKRICQQEKITLIHTHDSHAHSLAIIAAVLWGNRVPLVVSRRVDFPVKKSWFSAFKYNHKVVKRILCVSDTIKEITRPAIRQETVLATVYSGIDTNRIRPEFASNKLRQMAALSAEHLLIGNVAALAPHKDYFTFIDAARHLLNTYALPVHFFIIGSGKLKEELEAYAVKNGVQKNVTFTGFRSDIPEVLPELDIFLITSETEGLGTSILDAFLAEVPVVATEAGGIPELVEHEVTGLSSPVKDAKHLAEQCIRLMQNPALGQKLAKQARTKAEQFNKQTTGKQTLAHYQRVLSEQ